MTGRVRVGVGGWVFEPWRGSFYPEGLPQKRELEYASRQLTTIEINGTYYGSQKPESFARWREETPDDFVFAVKGPRFATNRRVLAEAGQSVERFFSTGVMELREKLGPVNWQFMATKKLDLADFAAFLALLPKSVEGRAVRHAVEVRHASFRTPDFVALAREHESRRHHRARVRLPADRRRHRPLRLRPADGHQRRPRGRARPRGRRALGRPRPSLGRGRSAGWPRGRGAAAARGPTATSSSTSSAAPSPAIRRPRWR